MSTRYARPMSNVPKVAVAESKKHHTITASARHFRSRLVRHGMVSRAQNFEGFLRSWNYLIRTALLAGMVSGIVPFASRAQHMLAPANPSTAESLRSTPSTIVIGFMGGMVKRDEPNRSEVLLAAKMRQKDDIIPANVAEAMNFFQPDGMLHGRKLIRAENPDKTKIIGNYQFSYKHTSLSCKGYPWQQKLFAREHMYIECDPQVWSQVESLIRSKLPQMQSEAHGN